MSQSELCRTITSHITQGLHVESVWRYAAPIAVLVMDSGEDVGIRKQRERAQKSESRHYVVARVGL